MANKETKRIKPEVLDQDQSSFDALTTIAGYTPVNPDCAPEAVTTKHTSLRAAQAAEVQAQAALDAARDNAVAMEWEFHNLMLAVKDQVAAQFGRDSNEYQALGLKKKSERKAPTRKSKG